MMRSFFHFWWWWWVYIPLGCNLRHEHVLIMAFLSLSSHIKHLIISNLWFMDRFDPILLTVFTAYEVIMVRKKQCNDGCGKWFTFNNWRQMKFLWYHITQMRYMLLLGHNTSYTTSTACDKRKGCFPS